MSMSQQFVSPRQLPQAPGDGEEESKQPEHPDDGPQDNDPDDVRAVEQDVWLLMRASQFIGSDVNNCEEIPWGTEEGAVCGEPQVAWSSHCRTSEFARTATTREFIEALPHAASHL